MSRSNLTLTAHGQYMAPPKKIRSKGPFVFLQFSTYIHTQRVMTIGVDSFELIMRIINIAYTRQTRGQADLTTNHSPVYWSHDHNNQSITVQTRGQADLIFIKPGRQHLARPYLNKILDHVKTFLSISIIWVLGSGPGWSHCLEGFIEFYLQTCIINVYNKEMWLWF